MDTIHLNDIEKEAREVFLRVIVEGTSLPCDVDNDFNSKSKLPTWFDDAKFKRGQKYFFDNQFGMMQAYYCGLISLLCDPEGLTILHSTGRSSTAKTARKRYISTTMHMLSWYEIDLSPGSKSWASLDRVRKMHQNASKRSQEKKLGFIMQAEVSLTVFGFLGYVLLRPHLLGIQHNDEDDREGFVHFWAVIAAMLGVQDRFNICLPRLAVVEMICKLCQRHIFIPLLQIETTLFKSMVQAVLDGLSDFNPFNSYESIMFFVRRAIGIPGYQHNVDLTKEYLCRRILSNADINSIRKVMNGKLGYEYLGQSIFDERVILFDVQQDDSKVFQQKCLNNTNIKNKNEQHYTQFDKNNELEILGLRDNEKLIIVAIENENDFKSYLGDHKFQLLSRKDQLFLKIKYWLISNCNSRIGCFINESLLSCMLYRMKKAYTEE